MTAAFYLGRRARREGKPALNPFHWASEKHRQWNAGYYFRPQCIGASA